MKTETPPPTIAELWKEAEYLIELTIPHLEGLANPKNRVNEERRPIFIDQLAKCNERLQALRQQLVERSKEFGYEGMRICEIWGDGKPENRIFHSRTCQFLKAEEAREFASALMFWAWELEQREKEAKGE